MTIAVSDERTGARRLKSRNDCVYSRQTNTAKKYENKGRCCIRHK